MRRTITGFLAGLIVGAGLALGVCILAAYLCDISQFEGAYAMQVAFGFMPLGGLVGGIAGAIRAAMRR